MQIYEVKVLFYYSVLCHVQCLRCRRSEVKAELTAVSLDYLWPLPVSLYTAVCVCVCDQDIDDTISFKCPLLTVGLNQFGL